jgi:hypothetical protein
MFADFGLFKGTKFSFGDTWDGEEVISEAALEKRLNKDGLRFRMNRTPQEQEEVGVLGGGALPSITLNLPIIGETYIGPPKVASVWEALGFTATSNNKARQQEKLKAIEKARTAKKGVLNGPGATIRSEWLKKYGYPRLVGSGGIFYADQLSTDEVPMVRYVVGVVESFISSLYIFDRADSTWASPEQSGRYQTLSRKVNMEEKKDGA